MNRKHLTAVLVLVLLIAVLFVVDIPFVRKIQNKITLQFEGEKVRLVSGGGYRTFSGLVHRIKPNPEGTTLAKAYQLADEGGKLNLTFDDIRQIKVFNENDELVHTRGSFEGEEPLKLWRNLLLDRHYTFVVELKDDGTTYIAEANWPAAEKVNINIGSKIEEGGVTYQQISIDNIDFSEASYILNIASSGYTQRWTAYERENFWFPVSNYEGGSGPQTLIVEYGGKFYQADFLYRGGGVLSARS